MEILGVVGLLVLWSVLPNIGADQLPEAVLQKHLFQDYNPNVRPVLDHTKPVNVTVALYLVSIVALNELEQTMSSTVWLAVNWFDELLKWNASMYGGVTTTYVTLGQIWTPDILFRNEIGNQKGIRDTDFADPFVQSSGEVYWWPGKDLKTKCEVDTTKYPFDIQDCTLEIGKWYSDDCRINIDNITSAIDTSPFQESEEWELIDTYARKEMHIEANANYSRVVFGVKVKRRSLFFVMNIMFPLLFLSILNQFCFVLPIESGEKIGMCMAICLTFTVFLSLVGKTLPQSSVNIPAYCVYLVFQNILSLLTISSEVLVLRLYHTEYSHDSLLGKTVCLLAPKFGVDVGEDDVSKEKGGQVLEPCVTRRHDTAVHQQAALKLDKLIGWLLFGFNVLFTTGFFLFANT